MKLIVGLGNPGAEYENTHHNIGFLVVDKLSKELLVTAVAWSFDKKHKAYIAKCGDVLLVKPNTYMNNSGEAVELLRSYYHVEPNDIWVIHDDIDLPPGKIRIRANGASGGHNGVDSILKALGTDTFVRFRLGVGRAHGVQEQDKSQKTRSVINFVLSKFDREAGTMKHLVKHGSEAVETALKKGVDKAMNMFN
jgi:peptidyl-tRNA hydrolase, PTH1 family